MPMHTGFTDDTSAKRATYKLLKASGGVCHYAEVTLAVRENSGEAKISISPDVFHWIEINERPRVSNTDEFVVGARLGAEYGLKLAGRLSGVSVLIEQIHYTLVDSTQQAVAFAACKAIEKVFDLDFNNDPRFEGRKIIFANAEIE